MLYVATPKAEKHCHACVLQCGVKMGGVAIKVFINSRMKLANKVLIVFILWLGCLGWGWGGGFTGVTFLRRIIPSMLDPFVLQMLQHSIVHRDRPSSKLNVLMLVRRSDSHAKEGMSREWEVMMDREGLDETMKSLASEHEVPASGRAASRSDACVITVYASPLGGAGPDVNNLL